MIGPNKGSDENLWWAFGKRERSIETSNKSGLTAGRRPFRCYRLNVELETGEVLIFQASARQLHISGNFTLVNNQECRFRVNPELANQ
jgi:hypothetical protein